MLTLNKQTSALEWTFDGNVIPTAEQVQAEFQASEHSNFFYLEQEVSDSINHLQQQVADEASDPPAAQNFKVAEKRDSKISFEFDKECMSATIIIDAPFGGKTPDVNALKKALAHAGITNGVLLDTLLAIPEQAEELKTNDSLSLEIATGKIPVQGKDAYIEFLTRSAKDRMLQPKVKDNGKVDMLDLGDPITVEPKQALARRHPPKPGIDGYTVKGKKLLAPLGKDITLKAGDGSEVDPNNPDILLATKEGLPLVSTDSVSVDDVMTLKKVNVTTGHVRFNGSLMINGDVGDGMKVESDGDIHITGSVESAFISAGGSITVNNGIIGKKTTDDHQCSCTITAKGDVTAQFAQYTEIKSNKDIVLLKQSNHCQLSAGNKIIIGTPERANGRLIGGHIESSYGVEAGEIGAPSGAKTEIAMAKQYKKAKDHLHVLSEKNTRKYEAMKQAAQRVKKSNEEGCKEEVLMALEEFKEYKAQAQEAQLELDMAKEHVARLLNDTACVANTKLHSRVNISVGESHIISTREHGPSIIHYVDGKLSIEPKMYRT